MNKNVKFNYLYRDAGNYKSWGAVIFSNPDKLSPSEVENRLREAFFQSELFIASQVGIPEVFLYAEDAPDEDDVCFHEFDSVEVTNEILTDLHTRTVKDFVEQVELESAKGWHSFIPQLRRKSV